MALEVCDSSLPNIQCPLHQLDGTVAGAWTMLSMALVIFWVSQSFMQIS